MRHCCRATYLLYLLLLVLSSACDSTPAIRSAPQVPAAPPRYPDILLRTGLVQPQHRRWLLFCDTTRLEVFRVGRTPRLVRRWLADYEELQQKHWHFNPDSLRVATKVEMRNPPPPPPPMVVPVSSFPTTPEEKQQARIQTSQLARQLLAAGLLTPDEYRILQPLAQAGSFSSRRDLLHHASEILAVMYRLRNSRNLAPMLQRLGLLTASQARQLALDLRAGRIPDPVDLLPRLPHARVFRRAAYPADLVPYLQQLHQDAAQLLPQLTFSDFRAEVVKPGQLSYCINCPEGRDVVVQLRVDGRRYTHRSALYEGKPGAAGSVYPEQFYQIFNQVLADRAAPYRLVFVEAEQETYLTGFAQRFGLWRLTAAQVEALDTLEYSALHFTPAAGFSVLPTDSVTAALRAFEKLGFVRHLSLAQRKAAEARLRQARVSQRQEVLRYLPGSLGEYRGFPDYATWSYPRLLSVLSRLSGGQFRPSQVQDYTQRTTGQLHFRLEGRSYHATLGQASERPDARLFQLVQRALHDHHLPGKFYELDPGLAQAHGMVNSYVFLLPEQENSIRRRGLLHLLDPTLTQEEQFAREEAQETNQP